MVFAKDHNKLSSYDRMALQTSSPRVHLAKKHDNGENVKNYDRVQADKTTITAFVPVGK